MRDFYQKKLRQTYRISRKTLDFASLVLGTALAVLFFWGGQTCRYRLGVRPQLIWSLLSGIIASIISRQFSPKPFYHFAAGRFRQRMQEQQAEDLRRNKIQEK